MTQITNLLQFSSGTKISSDSFNTNFETLREANNTLDTEIQTSIRYNNATGTNTITSVSGVLTLLTTTNGSNSFLANGTEAITSITGWTNGIAVIRWNTSRLLTYSSNLLLQNTGNRQVQVGDVSIFELNGGVARELNYFPATSNFNAVLNSVVVPYSVNTGTTDFNGNASFITSLSNSSVQVTSTNLINIGGTVSVTALSNTITGIGTLFTKDLQVGSVVTVNGEVHTISAITSDLLCSSLTNFISTANTVNIYLNNFLSLTHPNGLQEQITANTTISSILEGNTTFIKEEGNSAIQGIQTTLANQDLLMDFKTSLTNDAYGNIVNLVGSGATLSGNQFVSGTNTGLIASTITNIGTGTWTLEGRFTIPSLPSGNQTIFATNVLHSIQFYVTSAGHLSLYISSNGSTDNIVNGTTGTATLSANVQYHIALQFTGSAYNVYVNGVLDQTTASTTPVYTPIGNISFGYNANYSTTECLNGKMQDLRVTIGRIRYGGAFTPPTAGSLVMDRFLITESVAPPPSTPYNNLYWLQTGVKPMQAFKLISGVWTALPFTKLGECTVTNAVMGTPISYAFNGRYESGVFSVTTNSTYTYNSNLGFATQEQIIDLYGSQSSLYPYIKIGGECYDGSSWGANFGASSKNTVKISTGANSPMPPNWMAWCGGSVSDPTTGIYFFIVRRSF